MTEYFEGHSSESVLTWCEKQSKIVEEKKKNYRSMCLMTMDTQILKGILAN